MHPRWSTLRELYSVSQTDNVYIEKLNPRLNTWEEKCRDESEEVKGFAIVYRNNEVIHIGGLVGDEAIADVCIFRELALILVKLNKQI